MIGYDTDASFPHMSQHFQTDEQAGGRARANLNTPLRWGHKDLMAEYERLYLVKTESKTYLVILLLLLLTLNYIFACYTYRG